MAQPGYAVENQPVVLDGVTELLVHGVGGESAEDTLREPHPRMVAGDATAGFYRGPDVEGRHRESYSWGALTLGAGQPGPVAAAAAVRAGQPGRVDALAAARPARAGALPGPDPGVRADPDRARDAVRLLDRLRPDRLPVRRRPGLRRRPAVLPAVVVAAAVGLAAGRRLAGRQPAPAAGRGPRCCPWPWSGCSASWPVAPRSATSRASRSGWSTT